MLGQSGENRENVPSDDTTRSDIPEQYKNIGFAKSVRENFSQHVPSENKFDFVEQYLANKLQLPKTPHNSPRKVKPRTVPCDVCTESFVDQSGLAAHKLEVHPVHQCTVCLKTFAKVRLHFVF